MPVQRRHSMLCQAIGLGYGTALRRIIMDEIVIKPSADDIRQADAEFDSENKILEEALKELFGQYPHNSQPAQVLLKVTALNTLYSTQIPLYRKSIRLSSTSLSI